MSRKPVIVACNVGAAPVAITDPPPQVIATFDDGTREALFRYYQDEVTFEAKEFIGLTADQARTLYGRKYRVHLVADC